MARITRYDPDWSPAVFWPVARLHQEMNRLFTDAFRGLDETGEAAVDEEWIFSPVVDVEEGDDQYLITAELPGVTLEDIDVSMDEDMLVISGSKERRQAAGGERKQSERIYGRFRRAFRLPDDVDEEGISARFNDGVLSVKLPRSAGKSRVSRRIQIEEAASGARRLEGGAEAVGEDGSGEEGPEETQDPQRS